MLQKGFTRSLELSQLSGFNKMLAHKLNYFRLNGKLAISLAAVHGLATGYYFLCADRPAFKANHGLSN